MTALRTLDHRWRAWWRYAERPYARAYKRRAIASRDMGRAARRGMR